jgi:hypothetical protein
MQPLIVLQQIKIPDVHQHADGMTSGIQAQRQRMRHILGDHDGRRDIPGRALALFRHVLRTIYSLNWSQLHPVLSINCLPGQRLRVHVLPFVRGFSRHAEAIVALLAGTGDGDHSVVRRRHG